MRKYQLAPLLLLALVTLSVSPGFNVYADSKAEKEQELKTLNNKIKKLKDIIAVKIDSKSQYARQLKAIEKSIGGLQQKIRAVNQRIRNNQSELKTLRRKKTQHQKQLSNENDLLASQVYSAYTIGRQEQIKLLFSQQDANLLQRNLVYYEYLSNARVDLIDEVEANISAILETENKIQTTKTKLEENQQSLLDQKKVLDRDKKKRTRIIASLDSQLKKQGTDLSKLEDDANRLQELIASIVDLEIVNPAENLDRRKFADLRGKLAWPVDGKVRRLFGKKRNLSDLKWKGIIIEGKSGEHVRSVSHGRVAFADWLRGFGNLIIIDHGNSYMSLYGHNEALFKSAGDWVESGDVISSIGNSGGHKKTGLYFEIRKKGKPQNPTRWCKAGNQFTS